MFRFLIGSFHPVVVEAHGHWHVGEPGDDVPVKIDRIQLYMRDRMQQGDPPLWRARSAARYVARAEKLRLRGAGRMQRRCCAADLRSLARRPGRLPEGGVLTRKGCLFPTVSRPQHRFGHFGKRLHRARTASRTSSTWPGTFTLFQTRAIVPSAAIRKVERSIPMNFLPYMLFSFQTP